MENRGVFIILLVIVAILTVSLAMMAGYIFIFADNNQSAASKTDLNGVEEKIPDDDELAYYDLYTDKTNFNLKSEDNEIHVLQITAKLNYYKKVKGIKNVEEKLILYESKIKELIGTYFQSVTINEVPEPEEKERIKNELTEKINELLNLSEEKKNDIIYTIVFDEWFFQ